MSYTITLEAPILPEGAFMKVEIPRGQLQQGIKDLSVAIDAIHEESDKSRDTSPGERALNKRMEAIEKAIISTLPAEVKLSIANEAAGT